MAKAKKLLSVVLVALFTMVTMLSYVPAQAAKKKAVVPQIQLVENPNAEYTVGERMYTKVQAPNYSGKVEYRAVLWDGNAKQIIEVWKTYPYYYKNWQPTGTTVFPITWIVEKPGPYRLTVYVRPVGSKVPYSSYVESSAFVVKEASSNNDNNNPPATATVDSIAPVADVTVEEGAQATLPSEVTLNMSDKTTKTAKVTWAPVDTTKAGEVTVEGTVEGTDKKVSVKVIVNAKPLEVKNVAANTAKSLQVEFNTAVDTTKAAFSVKRGSVVVSLTAKWNDAKTIATLSSSSKLLDGDYEVTVTVDSKELAKKTIKVEREKIAKIELTSETLLRTSNESGMIAFKVTNQYGEDITNSSLARNIQWSASTGEPVTASYTTGMITVTKKDANNNILLQLAGMKTVLISAIDSNAPCYMSKTVNVSEGNGPISDIQLKTITNVDNKEITVGDTTNKFYIEFEAKDINGNVVNSYELLKAGLMFSDNNFSLYSSNSVVASAKLIQDPADNSKALIQIVVPSANGINGTAAISAVTKTGKSSMITVDVKKAAALDTFTIMAPSQEVAVGDTVEIPFVAYDQNGKELKKFSDIAPHVNVTGNGVANTNFTENPDGSLKIMATFTQAVPYILTAITDTGKSSMVNVNVRAAAVPMTLSVDPEWIWPYMVPGSYQYYDFDVSGGGISLKDQYDRNLSLRSKHVFNGKYYAVKAEVPAGSSITLDGDIAYEGSTITLVGTNTYGSTTITFKLLESANADFSNAKILDTKTIVCTNVNKKDIVSYELQKYDGDNMNFPAAGDATSAAKYAGPYLLLVGKLANGGTVQVDDADIVSVATSNNYFKTMPVSDAQVYEGAIKVYGMPLPTGMTEATGKVIVNVKGYDGRLMTASADVKSKSEPRIASKIALYVYNTDYNRTDAGFANGITRNGDILTIDMSALNGQTVYNLLDHSLLRYDAITGGAVSKADFFFDVYDQFNRRWLAPTYIDVIEQSNGLGAAISQDGKAVFTTARTPVDGDYVVISAVTGTGLTLTIRINFTGIAQPKGGVNPPPVVSKTALTTAITAANAVKAAAVVGNNPGQYPQAAMDAFTTAIAAAQAVVDNATATQAQVDAAKDTLAAAQTTFQAAVVPQPAAFIVSATAETNPLLGTSVVKVQVTDGTKVTGVKVNGTVQTVDEGYVVEGNLVTIFGKNTDTIIITANGQEYTVTNIQ